MKTKTEKKCIALHLPVDLVEQINNLKEKSGMSQSSLMTDLIGKGLGFTSAIKEENCIYFFVKVRIDLAKMTEMGQKLKNGELDKSNLLMTYCLKDDPSVGLNFWRAKDQKNFEEVFSPHRAYYKDVIEIIPVITPFEAMNLLLAQIK